MSRRRQPFGGNVGRFGHSAPDIAPFRILSKKRPKNIEKWPKNAKKCPKKAKKRQKTPKKHKNGSC
jgi:hypothetical protein